MKKLLRNLLNSYRIFLLNRRVSAQKINKVSALCVDLSRR